MKILIDINHPAHVHYFRNFYNHMVDRGHKIRITAKHKDISIELLDNFGIPYFCTGKNKTRLINKFISVIKSDYLILKESLLFKPDIYLSFFSLSSAHIGTLLNKPVIGFADTEHANLSILTTKPFTDVILTPFCFKKDLGKKQLRFDGYMELCYLHPNYFIPDPSVLDLLKLGKDDKYVIMRFVSWSASHDIGHSGLSQNMKRRAVKELSKYAKIFISSEAKLPLDLKKYQIKIPADRIHDALYYATLFYGESATMASECAVLGTPAIFLNNNRLGYLNAEEKKYNLVFNFSETKNDQIESIEKGIELLKKRDIKKEWQGKSNNMISDKIDVTKFMMWFVENYPDSKRIMMECPDYQYNFR